MKSFKLFIGSVIAIVCLVVSGGVFTSCTNDDDQLLAGDSQTEQVLSLDQDSVKAVTRGVMSSMGTGSVSSDLVVQDQDVVTFTFIPYPAYETTLTNSRIRIFAKITPSDGSGVIYERLTQAPTTQVKFSSSRWLSTLRDNTVTFVCDVDQNQSYIPLSNQYLHVYVSPNFISFGDDYPWPGQTTGQDTWGYRKGWCTSWVAFKVAQMWGESFHTGLGDAVSWLSNLSSLGYSYDKNPKVGDIVWIPAGDYQTNPTSGHVGFVNQVNGNTVTYTQYNGDPKAPNTYSKKTIYSAGTRYYIHVQKKI